MDHERVVELLGLSPHPEGGFYKETFRASASTAIYFLLPAGTFSAFHRIRSDEVWHHYDGDPLELHVVHPDGRHERVVLGRELGKGERPQHAVPGGAWQAAAPIGARFTLCGCTVAPAFDFASFEMPARAELLAILPEHADLVQRFSR
jgi:predicted cupin superfamily sugar epimerase